MYTYEPIGVCSKEISFSVKSGLVSNVEFIRGCQGNLIGVSSLVEGMRVEDVISRLKGIDCGARGTSCCDQFARALELYK